MAGLAGAASLSGQVTDARLALPLAEVTVLVTGTTAGGDTLSRQTETDRDGRYELEDLPAGSYEVEFLSPAHEKSRQDLTLGPDESRILDVELAAGVTTLDDLVVVGRVDDIERDLQTGYVNLDASDLERIPGIIEPDPLRALQVLPGVAAASDISSGLYIRGGGPDQTLVLMDGVTVYNPTHAFGFFSTFNNDVVGDLALYKGAYPAAYGGRLGAVLDVGMKRPTSDRITGKVGLSFISARATVEGRLGPDHWLAAGRRSFLEPILDAVRTRENPIPDYSFYDLNGIYTTTRGSGRTTLSVYHGRDDVLVDADQYTGIDLSWGNTVAYLRHQRPLGEKFDGEISLSTSRYKSVTDASIFATAFDIDNRLDDVTLSGSLDWRVSDPHRLVFGASYSWYDFTYVQNFNREQQVDYGSQPEELAIYAEDKWFADELTTVRSGLRLRHLSDGDRTFLEPRISLSRAVRPDLRLKLGGGLYNQYLQLVATEGFSAGDFYLPIDDSTDPGRSWQAVVGAEWMYSPAGLVSLEFYNTWLENLVEFDTRVAVDQTGFTAEELFVTGGTGYARGFEVFLRHQFGQVYGWLGYTLGWTSRTFDELNDGAAFPPKYDRRHDIGLVLSWETGSWVLGGAFRYATGQAFTPAASRFQLRDPATGGVSEAGQILPGARNSARLLPYHRLDLSARRPFGLFGLRAEFVIEIFNVYNRRNEWFVQYDTSGEVTDPSVVGMLPMIPSLGVNVEF